MESRRPSVRSSLSHAMLASACALAWASLAAPALAFTFSDGTSTRCIARGEPVPELELPSDSASFTGRTVRAESGYRIFWNAARLQQLPPVMHDFLFFHECAHAQVPTQEELAANCAGLRAMRSAGRAGFGVEAKIAAFYGPTNPYWTQTLACADRAPLPVDPAPLAPASGAAGAR